MVISPLANLRSKITIGGSHGEDDVGGADGHDRGRGHEMRALYLRDRVSDPAERVGHDLRVVCGYLAYLHP